MRRTVLTIGLALSAACALGLSAIATVDLAAAHRVPAAGRPLLVGVLELLSLGCAWGWVTSTDRRVQVEFAALMSAASAVSVVAGWRAFGWVGVVVPVALIGAVHVTSRMWTAGGDADSQRVGNLPPTGPPTEAAGPVPSPTRAAPEDDEAIVSALLALPTLPGRDAVKREFSVGTRRADRVLELARDRRRPHLVTAEEANR